jgi:hypothetical protein
LRSWRKKIFQSWVFLSSGLVELTYRGKEKKPEFWIYSFPRAATGTRRLRLLFCSKLHTINSKLANWLTGNWQLEASTLKTALNPRRMNTLPIKSLQSIL